MRPTGITVFKITKLSWYTQTALLALLLKIAFIISNTKYFAYLLYLLSVSFSYSQNKLIGGCVFCFLFLFLSIVPIVLFTNMPRIVSGFY